MNDSAGEGITWHCKRWEELNREELYALLQLRAEVFVVEQDCPYQDLDDKDRKGLHLGGADGRTRRSGWSGPGRDAVVAGGGVLCG